MKRSLILAALLAAFAVAARASDPMDQVTSPKANYTVEYSSMSVDGTSAPAVIPSYGAWRELYIVNPSSDTVVYYQVSDTAVSSGTLQNLGFPFRADVGRRLNTNKNVYFSLPSGYSALKLNVEVWKR